MKIGSLVELIDDNWDEIHPDEIFPVKNKIYTVREFIDDCLLLIEITNKLESLEDDCGRIVFGEIAFRIKRFRELQPPMKISIEQFLKVKI